METSSATRTVDLFLTSMPAAGRAAALMFFRRAWLTVTASCLLCTGCPIGAAVAFDLSSMLHIAAPLGSMLTMWVTGRPDVPACRRRRRRAGRGS